MFHTPAENIIPPPPAHLEILSDSFFVCDVDDFAGHGDDCEDFDRRRAPTGIIYFCESVIRRACGPCAQEKANPMILDLQMNHVRTRCEVICSKYALAYLYALTYRWV